MSCRLLCLCFVCCATSEFIRTFTFLSHDGCMLQIRMWTRVFLRQIWTKRYMAHGEGNRVYQGFYSTLTDRYGRPKKRHVDLMGPFALYYMFTDMEAEVQEPQVEFEDNNDDLIGMGALAGDDALVEHSANPPEADILVPQPRLSLPLIYSERGDEIYGLKHIPGLKLLQGKRSIYWSLDLPEVVLGPSAAGKRLYVTGWLLSFRDNDLRHAADTYLLHCAYCKLFENMCRLNPTRETKPYHLKWLVQQGLSGLGEIMYMELLGSLDTDMRFLIDIHTKGRSLDWDAYFQQPETGSDGRVYCYKHGFESGVLVATQSNMSNAIWEGVEGALEYLEKRFGCSKRMARWLVRNEKWSKHYSHWDMQATDRHRLGYYWGNTDLLFHVGNGNSTYAPSVKECQFDLAWLVDQMMVRDGEGRAPLTTVRLHRSSGITCDYPPLDVVCAVHLSMSHFYLVVCVFVVVYVYLLGFGLQLKSMCPTYLEVAFAYCRRVTDGVSLAPGRMVCPLGPFALINNVEVVSKPSV